MNVVSLKAIFLDHYTFPYLFPSDKILHPFLFETSCCFPPVRLSEPLLLCGNGAVLGKSRLVEHTHYTQGPLTWDCRRWLGYWIGWREDWSTHFPGGTESMVQDLVSLCKAQCKVRLGIVYFWNFPRNINRFKDSVWYPGDRKGHAHLQGQRNSTFSGCLFAAFRWETAAHSGSLLSHIILLHTRLHRWRLSLSISIFLNCPLELS